MTFLELLHLAAFNNGVAGNDDFMVTVFKDCFVLCNADTELLAIVTEYDSCLSFCYPDVAERFLKAVQEYKNV
jgi:hypothetical protein